MNTPLRAAIVGTGRIANTYDDEVVMQRPREFFQGDRRHPGLYTIHPVNHAESYRSISGYELVAVVGRDQERLEAFQNRWNVAAFDDVERMLAEVRPEVVSICTQSAEKAELTIRIAQADIGVRAIIVEKAMATSMAETDAMISSCEGAGIALIVNHPYRFSPMVREAHQLVKKGEIGAIGTLSGWSRGGAIHGGTHTFDLLRFFGGDIAEVTAWGVNGVDQWSDRGVSAMVRFTSGVTGFVSLERDAMAGFDIRGANGAISLSPIVGEAWLLRTAPLDIDSKRAYPLIVEREPLGAAPHSLSTTQRLLEEVRDEILTGNRVISTGRDGAAALEVGIASLISERERCTVSLPLEGELRNVSIPNR